MPRVAVVTGSSGFIGSRLVARLAATGWQVRCLVRPTSRDAGAPPDERVERHLVDFRDAAALRRSAALDGAEVVFHLAGVTKALTLDDFRAGNVLPLATLLQALAGRPALRRVVIVSSQAATGPAHAVDVPVTEDDAERPIEAYGQSKLEAEREALRWSDRLPITIVRPCSVYGPGDVDFLALFRMAMRGVLLFPGTRDSYLSLLHVDDVVDGLLAAANVTDVTSGARFFLAGETLRWGDLGERIAALVGRRVRAIDVPWPLVRAAVPFGEGYARVTGRPTLLNRHKVTLARPRFWICSGARAARVLGFVPRRALPDGLRNTYSWYQGKGWLRPLAAMIPATHEGDD